MGLCTGLLAAAAVSSSQSLSHLLPTAVHAVLIALRFGLCALKTGLLLDPTAKYQDSWSAVVMKIGIDEARDVVAQFCSQKVINSSISVPLVTESTNLTRIEHISIFKTVYKCHWSPDSNHKCASLHFERLLVSCSFSMPEDGPPPNPRSVSRASPVQHI